MSERDRNSCSFREFPSICTSSSCWEMCLNIIFQGHAFTGPRKLLAKHDSVSLVCVQSMQSKTLPVLFALWGRSHFSQKSTTVVTLSVFSPPPLPLSRAEGRGADTVLQPDLYSGQDVYYIKTRTGLCKSTCPTFLTHLPEAFQYKRAFDKTVGEVNIFLHCSRPSPPRSTHLLSQHIFLCRTCLISSCLIPDGTVF